MSLGVATHMSPTGQQTIIALREIRLNPCAAIACWKTCNNYVFTSIPKMI